MFFSSSRRPAPADWRLARLHHVDRRRQGGQRQQERRRSAGDVRRGVREGLQPGREEDLQVLRQSRTR